MREVQMVFLTATLPKHTEPEFMQEGSRNFPFKAQMIFLRRLIELQRSLL